MRPFKIIILVVLLVAGATAGGACADRTIQLSSINWEPYTGEHLPDHGFFSALVTAVLSRVGYRVEYHYRSWARALAEARNGDVHGVMAAYWKVDRVRFLSYPDVVWRVKEHFIALRDNPVTFNGQLADLKSFTVGVLNASAQEEELSAAGLKVESIDRQIRNVRKLLAGRVDTLLIPPSIFFYQAEQLHARFDRSKVKVLSPHYKIYDMYVAFSKHKTEYAQLTADFNRGLILIKSDGTYSKILQKHHIALED